MRCAMFLLLACGALGGRLVAGDASISGTTWVYVEKWEARRADVAPGGYTSPAVVLHFCPNEKFTMLKCMLYRHARESTTIGSDDGLEIYRGTWSPAASGTVVTYHLADAEITFTGYESAKKQQIKASVKLSAGILRMPVTRLFPPPSRDFPTVFKPKGKLPAPLQEKFIDCDEHPEKT
jgi:hypothetical protein